MGKHLKFIKHELWEAYSSLPELVNWSEFSKINKQKQQFSNDDFEYYFVAASLYSSKIEGNSLDANSFMRNRKQKDFVKKKEIQEIEDLVSAYRFASENKLNRTNLLKAHGILAKNIVAAKYAGKIRKSAMAVYDSVSMRPAYLAVEPEFVLQELKLLFADIEVLLERNLGLKETVFFASLIHLQFVLIHPFADGNGRSARLLEKWFLASKIGELAWSVNSEKYYWDNRPEYYKNVALGFNYYSLQWQRAFAFLQMLPACITNLQ